MTVISAPDAPLLQVGTLTKTFGGFTAPLVAERAPVDLIGLLNAMIPLPASNAKTPSPTASHRRHRTRAIHEPPGWQRTRHRWASGRGRAGLHP